MLTLLLAASSAPARRRLGATIDFTSADATAASTAPAGMTLVSRKYVPYGKGTGLAFGMGAAEQAAFDPTEKYFYTASEAGYVNVIDYNVPATPETEADAAIDLAGSKLTDVDVCGGLIAVGIGAVTASDNGEVKIYTTVKRDSVAAPVLAATIAVGPLPDMVAFNSDCTKLAVANEGEGTMDNNDVLTDPEGSITIVTGIGTDGTGGTATTVSLAGLATSDDDMIAAGVHLPLSLKAMEYWDDNSDVKDDLNFTAARAAYTTATQLEPEYVVWSADGTKVYTCLQENSAIATIDVPASGTPSAAAIKALTLKDWTSSGYKVDTNKDDEDCVLEYKPSFYSMRNPDSIATVTVDGTDYLLTADEGDDKEYGKFEEKQKFKDVIDDDGTFKSEFADTGFTEGDNAQELADAVTNFGDTKMAITIGSLGVDYSDPAAPVFKGAVGFGGRGISIWKASDMSLTWESGATFETEQCAAYPWAHNGIQDEEFGFTSGPLYDGASADLKETIDEMNDPGEDGCDSASDAVTAGTGCDATACACPLGKTVDERSLKDGAGPESIVVGEACGRLIAVTATEKQGTAFVFDITTIANPTLLFVKHLSPASEKKNPTVAYADGDLGDIDPESITFLSAEDSPTGNAGVVFAGAWSGTLSLYEFTASDGSKCTTASQGVEAEEEEDEPCFPATAMVTRADGTPARVDQLQAGDKIMATDVTGATTVDTVSVLSIANPEAVATYVSLATEDNLTIELTTEHHLPVGASCCSNLVKAKDVIIGEKVWTVKGATTVVSKTVVIEKAGTFSPVLTGGSFPIVDGIITAFDSIEKMTLASYGLGFLEATGISHLLRHALHIYSERTYIGGAEMVKTQVAPLSM